VVVRELYFVNTPIFGIGILEAYKHNYGKAFLELCSMCSGIIFSNTPFPEHVFWKNINTFMEMIFKSM